MNWTKERPTKPGWYWVLADPGREDPTIEDLEVVEVSSCGNLYPDRWTTYVWWGPEVLPPKHLPKGG